MKKLPCKECLVKVLCKQRLDHTLQSLFNLNCDIVLKWINIESKDNERIIRLDTVYKELGIDDF